MFGRLHRLGYYSEGPGCSAHNAIFTEENWVSLVDVHAKLRLLINSGVVSAYHSKTYPETYMIVYPSLPNTSHTEASGA